MPDRRTPFPVPRPLPAAKGWPTPHPPPGHPRPFWPGEPVRDGEPPDATPTVRQAALPRLDTCSADPQAGATIAIQRDWQAHVDAGRIGAAAPEPQPDPAGRGELRCAGLEAILRPRPMGIW